MDGVTHAPRSSVVDAMDPNAAAGPQPESTAPASNNIPDTDTDLSALPPPPSLPPQHQPDPAAGAGPTAGSSDALMNRPVLDSMLPSLVQPALGAPLGEIDALLRLAAQIEPTALRDAFSDIFLAVDKNTFGASPDPLSDIIDLVAAQAPPQFYFAFAASPFPRLVDIVGRIRNWMVIFMRRKEYYRTGSALSVLLRLPLSDDIIRQVKLQAVVRKLEKESGGIGSTAHLLIERFPAVFSASTDPASAGPNGGSNGGPASGLASGPTSNSASNSASSSAHGAKKAAPPKLFGNIGVLKMSSHKRLREPSPDRPPPQTENENADELSGRIASPEADGRSPAHSEATAPAPKRTKPIKHVRWKPDSELVAVRFYEMEGEARFKSAKNARQQEHDEGSAMHQGIDWATPQFVDFKDSFRPDFQAKMSSKRGGIMEPDSEEAETQEARESRVPMAMHAPDALPDSPKEPAAQDAEPEPGWHPRQAREPLAGAPVPPELRHKYEQPAPPTPPVMSAMPTMAAPFMSPMAAAMAQMNPMMAGYQQQFGTGYPMNMTQAQMSEMMARMTQMNQMNQANNMASMYGFQGMNRR